MRKALSGILLGILSFMFIILTTGTSNADVAGLKVTRVGYNAVGADTYMNRNSEYVDITASVTTDVKDLIVTDSWGHVNNADGVGCNAYKVTTLPGGVGSTDGTGTGTFLLANHTLRVYVGYGRPAASDSYHYLYMNSDYRQCGYNGHFINNMGDTLWITKGTTESDSFSFDIRRGYYVR